MLISFLNNNVEQKEGGQMPFLKNYILTIINMKPFWKADKAIFSILIMYGNLDIFQLYKGK